MPLKLVARGREVKRPGSNTSWSSREVTFICSLLGKVEEDRSRGEVSVVGTGWWVVKFAWS